MNVTGTVVSIEHEVQIAKNGGGSYPGSRVSYRDKDGTLREQNFHENALKFNAAIKNGLENLSAGDSFTMVKEKENDFWNVKQIFKGEAPVQANSTPAPRPAAAPASSGPNTFEVNNQLKEKQMKLDEIRQPLIVRQTCLKAAAELAVLFKFKTEIGLDIEPLEYVDLNTPSNNFFEDTLYEDPILGRSYNF